METSIFQQYAELDRQIKELEAKQLELKPAVTEELEKVDGNKVKSEVGQFFFTVRKTWTQPAHVKVSEDAFKKAKKDAEEKGEAKSEEKKSLTYKATVIKSENK